MKYACNTQKIDKVKSFVLKLPFESEIDVCL